MPGGSNSTNKFGPSSYVVGTPANGLGNGVNFTSIQAAINQAVADGFGPLNPCTILIRSGVYTENVTLSDGGIHLMGADTGSFNAITFPVQISGTLTLSVTGFNNFSLSNLLWTSAAGNALTISGIATPLRFSANNCGFTTSDPGFAGVSISVPSGTFGFANFFNCTISGDSSAVFADGRTSMLFQQSNLNGATHGIVLDGTCRATLESCILNAQTGFGIQFLAAGNFFESEFSRLASGDSIVDMTPGGSSIIRHNTFESNAASGFWIIGTGNLQYVNISNAGTALDLDPGLGVITINDWKPYATTTSVGAARFNPASFTVDSTTGEASLSEFLEGTATTVGAVTADIITIPLGATPGTWAVLCTIAAFESATPSGAITSSFFGFRTDGVTATALPVVVNMTGEAPSANGTAIGVAAGNNGIIQVTGDAGVTINWNAEITAIRFVS